MHQHNKGEHEPSVPVMDSSPQQTETLVSGLNDFPESGTVSEPAANLDPDLDLDLDFDLASHDSGVVVLESANSNAHHPPSPSPADTLDDPAAVMRKLLKGKEEEWNAASRRTGKLTLLELPLDVLRLIVNEVVHTNDLTGLALTNSTLYNLAVPHIYSRFDIVWPDLTHLSQSDSKSVDALTFGLSTLCLGSHFAHHTRRLLSPNKSRHLGPSVPRLKNDYASYIKKFSLGNGPDDWVAEYMITKESGKMLGTLVALAVAKMTSLETFVWDMPTGVLSDIFMALASLGDHSPDADSKLERVWVRWHDNSEVSSSSAAASPGPGAGDQDDVVPVGSTMTPIGILIPSTATHPRPRGPIPYSESRVEFPTFAVLPPLKSLSVLDIDELSYLDEMAVVIERSQGRLEELRVGISPKAVHKDFVQAWDGPGLHQVDRNARWPGEAVIGDRRLGGILGVLVGRIYDIRRKQASKSKGKESPPSTTAPSAHEPSGQHHPTTSSGLNAGSASSASSLLIQGSAAEGGSSLSRPEHGPASTGDGDGAGDGAGEGELEAGRKRLDGKLRLKTLELERVPISIQVACKAIDWTLLSSLTILNCSHHENLWKALRKQFQPTTWTAYDRSCSSSSRHPSSSTTQTHHHPTTLMKKQVQYRLNLKKIHTDMASVALVNFLKETLAPNSLEVFFLQDRRQSGPPPATIEQIFKGPIRRHRSSLRKVLLDSSGHRMPSGNFAEPFRWLYWMATSEMVAYMTSGRMTNLRELSLCLHYRDWHTFLQRLPNVPQLRSIHLPKIADHVSGNLEPRELALQIVDIVTLCPDIQLGYVGIEQKCFEILESKPSDTAAPGLAGAESGAAENPNTDDEAEEDDGSNADDNASITSDGQTVDQQGTLVDEQGGGGAGEDGGGSEDEEVDDSGSDVSSGTANSSDTDSSRGVFSDGKPRIRLREILFYDDKVAIFKARHGRL
ncbi:hypothetical protein SODALDRAFT_298640 [Sodiomyces alkalinus F11]|uniref:F-box domain-containing protein n=1 Tax=Sodiomyces alkalinus (strain CBS 110278 / VKM F-3762 / F11) TaxID=1314773 RepID=A0A3N2PR57_SODAK|nr:hypothetical protein SODALDRAFT_298640 [Sodiomyces alkalinus F11]ROT36934.1 hypothetical protein SODALDRAFT_298640 [Sodiomyces alkalinus F11]